MRHLLPARRILFVSARHWPEAPSRAPCPKNVDRGHGRNAPRPGALAPSELDPRLGDALLHHDRHHDDGRPDRLAGLQPLLLVFDLPDGKDIQDDPPVQKWHPRRGFVREVRTLRESLPVRVLPARSRKGRPLPRSRLHALPPLHRTLPQTRARHGETASSSTSAETPPTCISTV